MLKKLTLSFFFFILIFNSLAAPAFAFPGTTGPSYQLQFEKAVYQTQEMNLQSFVYETLKATAGSIITTITGCLSCSGSAYRAGAMWSGISLTSLIYQNPPASGVAYVADLGNRIGVGKSAYAADSTGYGKMSLVYMPIWAMFRNIAYIFFALVFVVIGFTIMFRVKISPQAVVTIQSAIPRMVIALILVTFSYAIVGFLIDMMYVILNLIVSLFISQVKVFQLLQGIPGGFLPPPPFNDEINSIRAVFMGGVPAIFIPMVVLLAVGVVGFATSGVTAGVGAVVGTIDIILMLVLIVLLFIALLRILWVLIKSYVTVVISLIFSPLILMLGAIPGVDTTGSWLKNIIANLMILPTITAMTLVASAITMQALNPPDVGPSALLDAFINIFVGTHDVGNFFKVVGESTTQIPNLILSSLISLGILLMTPKAADIIQSFITKKPFSYGTAIGEATGPVTAPVKLVGSSVQSGAKELIQERIRTMLP